MIISLRDIWVASQQKFHIKKYFMFLKPITNLDKWLKK